MSAPPAAGLLSSKTALVAGALSGCGAAEYAGGDADGALPDREEIADAYVFLASNLASLVTGTALVVDGGYTAM